MISFRFSIAHLIIWALAFDISILAQFRNKLLADGDLSSANLNQNGVSHLINSSDDNESSQNLGSSTVLRDSLNTDTGKDSKDPYILALKVLSRWDQNYGSFFPQAKNKFEEYRSALISAKKDPKTLVSYSNVWEKYHRFCSSIKVNKSYLSSINIFKDNLIETTHNQNTSNNIKLAGSYFNLAKTYFEQIASYPDENLKKRAEEYKNESFEYYSLLKKNKGNVEHPEVKNAYSNLFKAHQSLLQQYLISVPSKKGTQNTSQEQLINGKKKADHQLQNKNANSQLLELHRKFNAAARQPKTPARQEQMKLLIDQQKFFEKQISERNRKNKERHQLEIEGIKSRILKLQDILDAVAKKPKTPEQQEEIKSLIKQQEFFEKKISELIRENDKNHQLEIEGIKSRILKLQSRLDEVAKEAKTPEQQEEIKSLIKQQEFFENKISELNRENDKNHQLEIEGIKSRILKLQSRLDAVAKEPKTPEQQEEIKSLIDQQEFLEKKISELIRENDKNHQLEIEGIKSRILKLQSRLDAVAKEPKTPEQQEEIKSLIDQQEILKKNLSSLSDKKDKEHQQQVERLTAENQQLQEALETAKKQHQSPEQLKVIENLLNNNHQLYNELNDKKHQRELQKLRSQYQSVNRWQNFALRSLLAEKNAENESLKKQLEKKNNLDHDESLNIVNEEISARNMLIQGHEKGRENLQKRSKELSEKLNHNHP